MKGEETLKMFNDLPLSKEEELFVNREEELTRMANIGRFTEGSIYGMAGETGCGKTTLFNMLSLPPEVRKIVITITEKESKEAIVADLLHKLCLFVINTDIDKETSLLAGKTVEFLLQEETKAREKGVKIGKIIEGESKWARSSKERYNITSLKNRLRKVISATTKISKVVLCIDEIDKEAKKDVVIILDSIKDALVFKNLSSLITLPPVMYQQYLEDRNSLFSEGNLENILKGIIPINKMEDRDIREVLKRRIRAFPDILPGQIMEIMIKFADGNPREALLLCQNAILSKKIEVKYKKEDFILTLNEIKNEMEKFLRFRIHNLRLTPRETEMAKAISKKEIVSRKDLLNSTYLDAPKSTRHKVVDRLIAKKVLIETESDHYRVDRRSQLFYQFFEI